jgi:hypothetical protein
MAKTLPRPAASWLAAPVKVAGVEVVTVLLDLAVAEADGAFVEMVVTTAELDVVAGAADEAGAAELAGADEAGAADDEPPAGRAAQAAWAAVRVAIDISLVYIKVYDVLV